MDRAENFDHAIKVKKNKTLTVYGSHGDNKKKQKKQKQQQQWFQKSDNGLQTLLKNKPKSTLRFIAVHCHATGSVR